MTLWLRASHYRAAVTRAKGAGRPQTSADSAQVSRRPLSRGAARNNLNRLKFPLKRSRSVSAGEARSKPDRAGLSAVVFAFPALAPRQCAAARAKLHRRPRLEMRVFFHIPPALSRRPYGGGGLAGRAARPRRPPGVASWHDGFARLRPRDTMPRQCLSASAFRATALKRASSTADGRSGRCAWSISARSGQSTPRCRFASVWPSGPSCRGGWTRSAIASGPTSIRRLSTRWTAASQSSRRTTYGPCKRRASKTTSGSGMRCIASTPRISRATRRPSPTPRGRSPRWRRKSRKRPRRLRPPGASWRN